MALDGRCIMLSVSDRLNPIMTPFVRTESDCLHSIISNRRFCINAAQLAGAQDPYIHNVKNIKTSHQCPEPAK